MHRVLFSSCDGGETAPRTLPRPYEVVTLERMSDVTEISTSLTYQPPYGERLIRAAQLCRDRGLAGLIIGPGPELAYLTGSWISSHERLTALVIPSAQGEKPVLLAPGTDIGALQHSPTGTLPLTIEGWADGDTPHTRAVSALGTIRDSGERPVGLGSSLTTEHVLRLQALLGPRPTVLAAQALRQLFMRKDADEINQLREAARAIDAVHSQVPELLRAGRTEAEVASDIDALIREKHSVVDFIIVGSGPNGANPHHSFSDRVLEEGDLVVVDIGGTLPSGYHSDCTRTYVVGGNPDVLSAEAQDMYQVLYDAQRAALNAVRPGASAEEIDAAAREPITAAGYGDAFFHRTGHGIGLAEHEEPFIIAGNDLRVEAGMVFSVEPGIYLPDRYGARIEDIVAVTETGMEVLNHNPRELQ